MLKSRANWSWNCCYCSSTGLWSVTAAGQRNRRGLPKVGAEVLRLSSRHVLRSCLVSTRLFGTSASSTLEHVDLLERYREMVATGKIKHDEDQIRVVMQLRRLQKELVDHSPAMVAPHFLDNPATSSAWWADDALPAAESPNADSCALVSLKTRADELAELDTPKGLLLTGPPGSGKSFLVDLWLSCIPTPYKTRKHYDQLVLEIYRGVWEETQRRMAHTEVTETPSVKKPGPWNNSIRDTWRELVKTGNLPLSWRQGAPAHPSRSTPTIAFSVARRLILHHWLLVFDEIQLLDISSATLLADVLSWYWRMGGVIVGTSNKVPDEIYKHGVQRERLEPFVEGLKARCPVLTMRSKRDWRQQEYGGIDEVGRTWLLLEQEERFLPLLRSFCGDESEQRDQKLTVFGRTLHVPWSAGGASQFTFYELCDASLGPADYLTLAARFHTVGITNIPVLKLAAKNQARRFISLIDALYEARCRVVCLAETKPEELFFPDAPDETLEDIMLAETIGETRDSYRPNVSAYDSPAMSRNLDRPPKALALNTLSIFSGQEEQFAFKRALSRLIEMTSSAYVRNVKWAPLADRERTWERSIPYTGELHARANNMIINIDPPPAELDDFADEAAYLQPQGGLGVKPTAPRLKPDHVWGVRDDWGKQTGVWGQGATAYNNKEKEDTG
ncbi:AFG1-like ATPase-domain-containing protein [Mycena polygramma]|nr:AFG1-like ATPase-domain-containing protein [Mycena polygramma]